MPRRPKEYREIHKAADSIEPKMERAVVKALEATSVPIQQLAIRISQGDVRGALALLPQEDAEAELSPAGTIVRDAVFRGGRIGAKIVREET